MWCCGGDSSIKSSRSPVCQPLLQTYIKSTRWSICELRTGTSSTICQKPIPHVMYPHKFYSFQTIMRKFPENRSTMLAPKYELLLIDFKSCHNARVPKGEDLEFRKIKSSTYKICSRIVSSDNLVG